MPNPQLNIFYQTLKGATLEKVQNSTSIPEEVIEFHARTSLILKYLQIAFEKLQNETGSQILLLLPSVKQFAQSYRSELNNLPQINLLFKSLDQATETNVRFTIAELQRRISAVLSSVNHAFEEYPSQSAVKKHVLARSIAGAISTATQLPNDVTNMIAGFAVDNSSAVKKTRFSK